MAGPESVLLKNLIATTRKIRDREGRGKKKGGQGKPLVSQKQKSFAATSKSGKGFEKKEKWKTVGGRVVGALSFLKKRGGVPPRTVGGKEKGCGGKKKTGHSLQGRKTSGRSCGKPKEKKRGATFLK